MFVFLICLFGVFFLNFNKIEMEFFFLNLLVDMLYKYI